MIHLLDLGGDISGNGLSKLFLTIAAAFAEAERDRIREHIGQVTFVWWFCHAVPALRHGIGGSNGRVSATVSRTGIDGRSSSR